MATGGWCTVQATLCMLGQPFVFLLLLLLQVVATLTQVNNGDRPLVYPSCTRERNGRLCQKKLQGQEGSWCGLLLQLLNSMSDIGGGDGRRQQRSEASSRCLAVFSSHKAWLAVLQCWQGTGRCAGMPGQRMRHAAPADVIAVWLAPDTGCVAAAAAVFGGCRCCRFCETCGTTVEQPAYRYLLNVVVSVESRVGVDLTKIVCCRWLRSTRLAAPRAVLLHAAYEYRHASTPLLRPLKPVSAQARPCSCMRAQPLYCCRCFCCCAPPLAQCMGHTGQQNLTAFGDTGEAIMGSRSK